MTPGSTVEYSRFTVPVAGGELTVGRWGRGEDVVLAAHGITANHVSWQRVAELAVALSGGRLSLVAVDHRGRAGSAEAPGPYGLDVHADDLASVLDDLGLAAAVLAGHSLGAFIVATAAERHPGRVRRLVLVDGGLPLPIELPEGIGVEDAVRMVIGPTVDRLDQRWDDEEAYLDFYRAHPAFAAGLPPAAVAYVRYDAVTTPEGQIRSSCVKDAVLVDGSASIVDPESARAIERIGTPAHLLYAPRGFLGQTPGLYPDDVVAAAVQALPHLSAELVPDCNHYTIVVGERGAAAVAAALVAAI